MKYKFYEEWGVAWYNFELPRIKINEKKYKILEILCSLSWSYIREIVSKMEEVRDWKLDAYDFWPQDSVIVDVFWDNFENEKYRWKTIISKAFTDIFIEVPLSEIYNLMKDYLKEIDKWEKKTGREKPGW